MEQKNTAVTPQWMKEFEAQFRTAVAHAFILHFNTRDYMASNLMFREYIARAMPNRRVIAFYNLADGITFARASMRKDFEEIVGLDADTGDPLADNLAALGLGKPSSPQKEKPLPKAPAAAIPLLEKLLRSGFHEDADDLVGDAIVILEYAEAIVPNADVSLMSQEDRAVLVTLERLGSDQAIVQTGNALILLTENVTDLHPSLRRASSKYEQIEIALPNLEERKRFIQHLLKEGKGKLVKGVTADALAAATAMLSRMGIEDIFLRAAETDGIVTLDLVKERKRQIIAAEFGEVIEVMDPAFGFEDIGGLENVKEFFRKSVIKPIREQRYSRVPMGVLATGPAGTGKTAMAQAVAKESGMNCVVLNPAKLFGQYVGNTERNLDKALRAIDSMSPCLVFIDEIDQSVSRGSSGDSGVTNRFFKRLLEFMSDTTHRGKVVFMAATNRPDLMDAALRRPGRFDRKIPFLLPNAQDRANIICVMARRYGLPMPVVLNDQTEGGRDILESTDGWTGAELEAAVIKAVELMEDDALDPFVALTQAVRRLRPSTSDIQLQTLLAIQECNDTDLLPESYREELKDRAQLDAKVQALAAKNSGRTRREL